MLSHQLQNAIERYLTTTSTKQLAHQFEKLSLGYRQLKAENIGSSKEDLDAYLVGRFSCTLAVIQNLFKKIEAFLPDHFKVLDYGCGPATALCALNEIFCKTRFNYLGIEEKQPMLDAAQFLAQELGLSALWQKGNIETKHVDYSCDFAMASYVLNELENMNQFFLNLMKHDQILLIEPGTPDGTKRILQFRQKAIEAGFHVIMPCPHEQQCPMTKPKWCHFYQRVERSKMLRSVKQGSLGYEDEKYAYIFVSRQAKSMHHAVLVEKPSVLPYKITMKTCSSSGDIEEQDVLKKDKQEFKHAKKLDWGDFI